MSTLPVWSGNEKVGHLQSTGQGVRFAYAADWLSAAEGFSISTLLRRREAPHDGLDLLSWCSTSCRKAALRSERMVSKLIDELPRHPLGYGRKGVRMSLAGVQPKLGLAGEADALQLPVGDQPSTFIL